MDDEHSEIEAPPNKIGYCDRHLDSEMIPVGVFQAGVYGGDSGNCTAMEYWRCSRAECSRSYEPWRFGYFNLVWARGSRIEMNPCNQHRCGKHDEVIPFLLIAKVGDGRQFMCPHRGCFETGPVVAEHLPDTPNPTDLTPVTAEPRRNRNKEAEELAAFRNFAQASNLKIDEGSPQNAKSPHPDIRCAINGGTYWFELGRITDQNLAKRISTRPPADLRSFSFSQREPFVKIVNAKAAKKYETEGRPVDLLLHFDHQPADPIAVARFVKEYRAELDNLRANGLFTRVWIYDDWSKRVLWMSDAADE